MAKYKILSVKNKSLIYTVRGNKVYREDSDSLAYTIDGDRIYHGTKTFFEQPLYIINGNEIYANITAV